MEDPEGGAAAAGPQQPPLGEKIAKKVHVSSQLLQEVSVPGGARLTWRVSVLEDMDIDLAVHFQANAGMAGRRDPEREEAGAADLMGLQTRTTGYAKNLRRVVAANERVEVASGTYQTPKDGLLVFIFDNTFSWINEKDVEIEVLLPAPPRQQPAPPPGIKLDGAVMNPLLQ
jgi:hypothetical protein